MADDNSNKTDYLTLSSNDLLLNNRNSYDNKYVDSVKNMYKFLNSSNVLIDTILKQTVQIAKAKGKLTKAGVNIYSKTEEPAVKAIQNTVLVVPKTTAETDYSNRYETPSGNISSGTGNVTVVGSNNAEAVWNFLIGNLSMDTIHAAGIMGNLAQENQFNTDDNDGGLGLMQWIGDRREACIDLAIQENKSPTDLSLQLEYMATEFQGSESAGYNSYIATSFSSPATAAVSFCDLIERAGEPMYENRESYAQQYYDMYAK